MSEIPGRLITYCTNIHPGESWQETFAALRRHIPAVKAAVSPDRPFPIGLRLSRRAAGELTGEEHEHFVCWLRENDCFVPTLNGFPYGSFHGARVKEQVYLPDWRSPDRAAYTMRLADLLAGWLPEGIIGSISTVPIGFKGVVGESDRPSIRKQLVAVLAHLKHLQHQRGRKIVLALEPEPGCLLETTEEVCNFFSSLDLPHDLRDMIGICYDCCHQAVEFEEPADSLARLENAGVRIAKVQISSALNLLAPSLELLSRFDEPCYLHQVVVRNLMGELVRYNDLSEARVRHSMNDGEEWRCHFHVPIFLSGVGGYGTTRFFLEEMLPLLPQNLLLEVETYTWDVLPPELRRDSVTDSIIREIQWLEAHEVQRTVVLNVVGLTRALLGGPHTPCLNALLPNSIPIQTITPAVTCSVQATYLTGRSPASHGIVGNGWYFRDLGEVLFWRQSNQLIQGDRLWDEARRRNPAFTVANTFWWYAMNTGADYTVTPRPLYCADGRKLPDCYSAPLELRDHLNRDFGQFPLFKFWGPATSIASSDWIGKSAMAIEEKFRPTLQLVYLPHLDYCLQKVGTKGNIEKDLAEIDALCGQLLDFFQERDCRVVVLSEYGITSVNHTVHPNRILREAGLLSLKVDLGREYLDSGTSRAFAVADHQVCHIYVRDTCDILPIKSLFSGVPGIELVLDQEGKKACGLDHERSGELVLVASANSWFTYYWWLDDHRAPDYARTVNIHAKPGYDPCELFLDPAISFPKLKIATLLAKKMLGFRYLMDVIPLDATLVRGSHGRITDAAEDGPLLLSSAVNLIDSDAIKATDVYDLLLRHVFAD